MALAKEARLEEQQRRQQREQRARQREQRARQRMSQSADVATGRAGKRSLASPRILRAAMTPPSTPPPAERKSRARAVRVSLRAQGSYPDLRTVFGAPESPMAPTPLPWFLPRDNGLPPRTNPPPPLFLSFSPSPFRSLFRAATLSNHHLRLRVATTIGCMWW